MRRVPLALLTLLLVLGAAPDSRPPAGALSTATQVPVQDIAGTPMLGANDLARLLTASRYWRSDVRKLVLRAPTFRLTLTEGTPFAVLDTRTLVLPAAVASRGGELQVPVALLALLPDDSTRARLVFDPVAHVVRAAPRGGFVGAPRVQVAGGITRVVVPCERAETATVFARGHARFRVRVPGQLVEALGDSLPEGGLVLDLRAAPATDAVAFELALAAEAQSFRLVPGPGRLTLEFATGALPGGERFAPAPPAGPRAVRMIVIDPGHGGDDVGATQGDLQEKQLTLALAERLATELQRRLGCRVVLTRDDDRALTQHERAERANRERADLVIALHVDAFPSPRARGVRAWVPPATLSEPERGGTRPLTLLPWRDAAAEYAVTSRALAEAVTGLLELRGHGPVQVRERLPVALLGVHAPGMMLECGVLSSPEDRERLASPEGLARLAALIADGVLAWQRDG